MGVAMQRRFKDDEPSAAPLGVERADTPATNAIQGLQMVKVE
jgi:hypothetical protein